MAALARMRYPADAIKLLKEEDPNSPLTTYYLRRLIKTGAVPTVLIGRRHLVNVDALIEYLNKGAEPLPPETVGGIRRIN